jgi:hypothetical protein
MPDYANPIETGMTFLWEPMLPWATAHIKVTKVSEDWVWCRSWIPTDAISGDYTGPELANETDRFRQAVIPVDA